MFELPDAKRVRREDLGGSDSEDEAPSRDEGQDAELLAKLHARMAGMLDLGSIEQPAPTPKKKTTQVPPATKTTAASSDDSSDDDDEVAEDKDAEMTEAVAAEPEEFEFRLFSTAPATKIALVDEDELAFEGEGDMVRKRPLSYYLALEATPEEQAGFEEAAVSGEDVLERAKQRWWGMETPWRVIRVETGAKKGDTTTSKKDGESEEAAARRRRPGKRKRIALRMKEREKKKKAEEEEKAKMGKEEALKEKKKRINRLKKLRKRKKDKEAKQGGAAAAGDGADAEDSGEGSEGDDE
ncbi:hypothetical protein CkaCkLH20_01443 [Colletotrichum karsti]|uniref:Nucleolar protein n=1 Tax=Colletotrichum karsti TaxID=1095194 RepID=A0A9P6LPM0_9PEZI|nr:uncharacterized protein CkaCkLH20_01443 [Colletotrichum karsti]KAF9881293.1 hypothetical protein CkaCkLH20_01443 [Colletotrichum karsti]